MNQQRGEETRARILRAAQEGFARSGYDGTGVAEICRQAGVSKGAFYHHFPSKQAVFLELLNQWLAGLDAPMAVTRAGMKPVPQQLLDMAELVQHIFQAAQGQLPMFLEFWTQSARDPEVWQATIAPYQRYRSFFSGIIEAGIAEGTLRPVDPDTAGRVLVSLAVGLLLQGLMDPEGTDWGQVATEGVRMLLQGLEKPRESP